jgi:hypothetical protein
VTATSERIRNAVILVVLTVWVVVIAATLIQGKLPDAPLLGIPGAIWLALHPPKLGREEPTPPASPPTPAPRPAPSTPDEGGTPA